MNDFDERLRKLIHMERHNFAGSSSRAIVELVNLLFDFAIKMRASDLHIEPFEKALRVRYRIDGHLQELHQPLPMHLAEPLTLRIKILARMDTTAAFLPLDGAIKLRTADILINTTPLGMFPNMDTMPPVDLKLLQKGALVYDIVYNPEETKFLKTARELGFPTLNGMSMLLLQGKESYRLFTGELPDIEVMKQTLRRLLSAK